MCRVAAGVNDQPEHANQLADLLHRWGLARHVNLIPYNPVADSDFKRPTRAAVRLALHASSDLGGCLLFAVTPLHTHTHTTRCEWGLFVCLFVLA